MGCGSSKSSSPAETKDGIVPSYTPPGDFPTPKLLADCQDEYIQLYEENKIRTTDNAGRDSGIVPSPQPFLTRKVEIFTRENYVDIEAGVRKAPKILATTSLIDLSIHLKSITNDPVGLLYSAFYWMVFTSQNLHTHKLNPIPVTNTTVQHMLLAHAGYGTYNKIFVDLCGHLGFKVHVVTGRKKTVTENNIVSAEESSWPAILVNDNWHFVDVAFAATVLERKQRQLFKDDIELDDIIDIDEDSEFYFLTDPDRLIFSHFADDPEWQMLAKPVTYMEFKQMAHITETFFTMGFVDIADGRGVLESNNGEAHLDISLVKGNYLKIVYKFEKIAGRQMLSNVFEEDLENLITLTNEDDHKIFDIDFIAIGRYSLKVWAIDEKGKKSHYRNTKFIGQWFLECREPKFVCDANPVCQNGEFGPGADMRTYQVELTQFLANNGMAHVQFSTKDDSQLEFMYSVESRKINRLKLRQHIRHYTSGNISGIVIIFPEHGKYVLNTFVRKYNSTKTFKIVCSLLIYAKSRYADLTPFPPSTDGCIGYVSEGGVDLVAVSHVVPYCILEPNIESIQMKFKSEDRHDIMPYLNARTSHGYENTSSFVWFSININSDFVESILDIRFPFAGTYNLSIFARKASKTKGMIYKEAYRYIFVVNHPCYTSLPFPIPLNNWDSLFSLHGPKDGYLVEKENVAFSLSVKDISEVVVSHSVKTVTYQNMSSIYDQPDGSGSLRHFEGTINTHMGGHDLTMSAVHRNGGKTLNSMLKYTVLTPEEWSSQLEDQRTRQREGAARLKSILEQEKEIQNELLERDQEIEQEEHKRRQDFEQNRNQFLIEEDRLQKEFEEYFNEEVDKLEQKDLSDLDDRGKRTVVQSEIKIILEMRDRELRNRRRLYKEMVLKMAKEKLRNAISQREKVHLQKAISEYYSLKLPTDNNKELMTAERLIEILTLQKDLTEATQNREMESIALLLEEVMIKGYHLQLQREVEEARIALAALDQVQGLQHNIFTMEKKTMSELRSYTNPPEEVHTVMRAVLLLLGEDQQTTAEWSTCAFMCNPYGVNGLNRRIQMLNIEALHPEIVARVKEMVDGLVFSHIQRVNQGAATFFVWVSGCIDKFDTYQNLEDVYPANIERQRYLLGKNPLSLR